MTQGEVKSIVHDLIKFQDWQNPLQNFWSERKIEFNLLTGEVNVSEEDSFIEYCKNKRKWFIDRVKKLKGNVKDFEGAKIILFGAKEKVIIKYKGKLFEEEMIYGRWMEDQKNLRKGIKKLKPFDITKTEKGKEIFKK